MLTSVVAAGVAEPKTASSNRCSLSSTASGLAAPVLPCAISQGHSTPEEPGSERTRDQEYAVAVWRGPHMGSHEWCSWRMAAHDHTSASWSGRSYSWFEAGVGVGGCPGLQLPWLETCVASWPEIRGRWWQVRSQEVVSRD